MVVRENTEGFYADRNMFMGTGEFMPTPDVALAVRKITRQGSTRIAETAFELAMQRPRKKVTAVHKANVLRVSDGLFLECVRAVRRAIRRSNTRSRSWTRWRRCWCATPAAFDVIVTTNMFGDILSDEASEISGSLGLAASINAGDEHALAQAQHGSAPDIAGQDMRQPGLADRLGGDAAGLARRAARRCDNSLKAADLIERALEQTIAKPETRTRRSRRPARHQGVRRAGGAGAWRGWRNTTSAELIGTRPALNGRVPCG